MNNVHLTLGKIWPLIKMDGCKKINYFMSKIVDHTSTGEINKWQRAIDLRLWGSKLNLKSQMVGGGIIAKLMGFALALPPWPNNNIFIFIMPSYCQTSSSKCCVIMSIVVGCKRRKIVGHHFQGLFIPCLCSCKK